MNPWYTFIVAGLAIALDNLVTLISDTSSNSVTLTAKQRRITNIVRAASGLIVMGFAWLTISNGWSQSGLKITLTSIPEGMAYAFAVAGAFRVLASVISAIAFRILHDKISFKQEGNKVWLGAYMFILGTLAVVLINRNTSPILVPMLVLFVSLIIVVAMHLISIYTSKSKPSLSTTTKT
jgi:hypothetical protein